MVVTFVPEDATLCGCGSHALAPGRGGPVRTDCKRCGGKGWYMPDPPPTFRTRFTTYNLQVHSDTAKQICRDERRHLYKQMRSWGCGRFASRVASYSLSRPRKPQ